MGKSDPNSHKGDRWPWWAPRGVSVDDGARGGGQAGRNCIGQNWPRGDTHMALPTSCPTSCPSHSHGNLHWLLTPLLASADEECVRVSEDSRSPPCVSDLASAQPPSGDAHSGSRAPDGARGQRLTAGPPALPHQRIGPRYFRRICMDCSAANRPPGKHPIAAEPGSLYGTWHSSDGPLGQML